MFSIREGENTYCPPMSVLKARPGNWNSQITITGSFYRITLSDFYRARRFETNGKDWIERATQTSFLGISHKQKFASMIDWCNSYASEFWHNYKRNQWYFRDRDTAIAFHLCFADPNDSFELFEKQSKLV